MDGLPLLETLVGEAGGVIALIVEWFVLDILSQRGDRFRKFLLGDEGATEGKTGFVFIRIETQGFTKLNDCCVEARWLGSGFKHPQTHMGFGRIRVSGDELLQGFRRFSRLPRLGICER